MDIDEMAPESATSHPGVQLIPAIAPTVHGLHQPRAKQAIDDGRRGKGYGFGALQARTGAVLTAPSRGRTTANFVDFLENVDCWVPAAPERGYVVLDNLSTHRAADASP